MLIMLTIEEPGHFHGRRPPRPWAAEITGTHRYFGLARTFIQALRDFRDTRVAMSGNVYGIVTRFPLREGKLYEVGQVKGRSSRQRFEREFFFVEGGELRERTAAEAVAYAHHLDSAVQTTGATLVQRGKHGSRLLRTQQ